MQVAESIAEVRQAVRAARLSGARIGCVPTMGALHAGHVSLIHRARSISDFVVTTIFVNPTQFAPGEDLAKYPRPRERDLELCRDAGSALVLYPQVEEMYRPDAETIVDVGRLGTVLEGVIRPTHFRGVTTVVMKLFQIVQPDVACFGAKDYQQQSIIRRMVRDLDVPVEIDVCPTVRDPDGLALSSRNAYLSPEQRVAGLSLWRSLQLAEHRLQAGEQQIAAIVAAMTDEMDRAGMQVDYAVIADPDSLELLSAPQTQMVALVAARIGTTRLIDNLTIHLSE